MQSRGKPKGAPKCKYVVGDSGPSPRTLPRMPNGAQPFVRGSYEDPRGKTVKKKRKKWFTRCFSLFFKPKTLQNLQLRGELRKPKFDRFRSTFSFFIISTTTSMKNLAFPFIFLKTGPETILNRQISRFATDCTNRELAKPKSDRLGEKTSWRHFDFSVYT